MRMDIVLLKDGLLSKARRPKKASGILLREPVMEYVVAVVVERNLKWKELQSDNLYGDQWIPCREGLRVKTMTAGAIALQRMKVTFRGEIVKGIDAPRHHLGCRVL